MSNVLRIRIAAASAAVLMTAASVAAQGMGAAQTTTPQSMGAPQTGANVAGFGRIGTPPPVYDIADNYGFVSLFDGTLKGWDYDANLWDIKDGAIHIAATCEKPTGTVYAISTAGEFGDFILKYEMKGTGMINGGIQFRSYVTQDPAMTGTKFPAPTPRTPPAGGAARPAGAPGGAPGQGGAPGAGGPPGGIAGGGAPGGGAPGGAPGQGGAPGAAPRAPRPAACANPGTAPTRASQAKWDMSGPQADFDARNTYPGMNYEQSGRAVIATPGYSMYADANGSWAIAQIADKATLAPWFKKDDWNQFVVVAVGHSTSIYMNGHLITQFVDNDPRYFRSSGKIGVESESMGDLWTRNIMIRKL